MSAADGRVLATTQIVDHGPATRRWNLVLMGDGYRMDELGSFHDHAEGFAEHLRATEPFRSLWSAVNVFRIDVVSNDSGADDPMSCEDGSTGSGARAATFFDAAFCSHKQRRLLCVDEKRALEVARTEMQLNHAAMVIVNTSTYGGSGGGVSVFSTAPDAFEIGVHELGHTFFKLADEYDSGEANASFYTGLEPQEPNVTRNSTRPTIKWGHLIAATTAVPTLVNPNCARHDTQPSPVPEGTVGAFAGARYFRCGLFRPEFDCKMRTLGRPFCAVCRAEITRQLQRFL